MGQIKNIKLHIVTDIKEVKLEMAFRALSRNILSLRGTCCHGIATPKFIARPCSLPAAGSGDKTEFQTLLETSPLMQALHYNGQNFVGKIWEVVNDDIYVDYGGKFMLVGKRPEKNPDAYNRGALVRVKVLQYEVSGHFLGEKHGVSMCESDGILFGLYYPPRNNFRDDFHSESTRFSREPPQRQSFDSSSDSSKDNSWDLDGLDSSSDSSKGSSWNLDDLLNTLNDKLNDKPTK